MLFKVFKHHNLILIKNNIDFRIDLINIEN